MARLTIKIEITVPDAKELLALLQTSPDNWPDVIPELEAALEEAQA